MTLEEVSEDVEVWPDNLDAVNVFIAMSTQWRSGMNGATGLDYSALPVVMDMLGTKDRQETFENLRTLEQAALETMRQDK